MARGTDFGGVHSYRDLHLVQAAVDVQPAKPKTNFIDIPGADGSKDLSELPAGRVVFETREITWTFKLYPGDHWATKYMQVSNALNGRACHITLHDDPDWYYVGRLTVDKHAVDSILHTITVVAVCQPYKLWQTELVATESLTTTYKTLLLTNDRMPVVPTITVSAATTVEWKGDTFSLSAGTHKVLDIELAEGANYLKAKTVSGTGTIKVSYRKGAL